MRWQRTWPSTIGLVLSVLAVSAPCAGEVALPAQAAFAKAIRVLRSLGAEVILADKELLLARTDPVRLYPGDVLTQTDCPREFGTLFIRSRQPVVAATYRVTVAPVGDARSRVSLSVAIGVYKDVEDGARFLDDKNKALTCKSTGVLETKFIELLSAP